MSNDLSAADYCPTCGQPRERLTETAECHGLRLRPDNTLEFEGAEIRIIPGVARFMRALMERGGRATHEFLILRVSPEMESNIVQVYVCRLRKILPALTRGGLELRTVWGWGYELASTAQQALAA